MVQYQNDQDADDQQRLAMSNAGLAQAQRAANGAGNAFQSPVQPGQPVQPPPGMQGAQQGYARPQPNPGLGLGSGTNPALTQQPQPQLQRPHPQPAMAPPVPPPAPNPYAQAATNVVAAQRAAQAQNPAAMPQQRPTMPQTPMQPQGRPEGRRQPQQPMQGQMQRVPHPMLRRHGGAPPGHAYGRARFMQGQPTQGQPAFNPLAQAQQPQGFDQNEANRQALLSILAQQRGR